MPNSQIALPRTWRHAGLVIPRSQLLEPSNVAGDPCVVWDAAISAWRMVLFYDPPGHAHAICRGNPFVGPWEMQGAIPFTNSGEWGGGMHKPFLVLDPLRPGWPACVDGRFWLLGVSIANHKQVWRAWSENLAGPWTVEPGPLIATGEGGGFDERHVDAITGYYFADREEFLYFYMGYPIAAQPGRELSPYGSAQGLAAQGKNENSIRKLGVVLAPAPIEGHWASGWVGGLQLLPGQSHRWIALLNASPTPVNPGAGQIWKEEPPPSLGGFAWSDEEWPVAGWHWEDQPLEWIEQIPADARANGEGTNLWRHYLLALENGEAGIFYNSGAYGKEQLYLKVAGD